MTVDTNIIYTQNDLGKNIYRKKTYYTLVVEQEVLAKDKDEAEQKFLDDGGIDHSQINHEITTNKNGVETYMVDANYSDSGNTEYMGKVVIEEDEDEPAYAVPGMLLLILWICYLWTINQTSGNKAMIDNAVEYSIMEWRSLNKSTKTMVKTYKEAKELY